MGCLTRMPYGSAIATLLCWGGVAVFLFCLHRATRLTLAMAEDVFVYDLPWLSEVRVAFIGVAALMGVVSLLLLAVGFFATGATRQRLYRGWKARFGGRCSTGMCMVLVYVLNMAWLLMAGSLVVIVFVFYVWGHMCDNSPDCVDLRQFHFFFPNGTDLNLLNICAKRKVFCTDTVQVATPFFMLSLGASIVVIISLLHYIMCLAANYTRIKDHEKIKDLQELQYLQDSEMGTLPKDRF